MSEFRSIADGLADDITAGRLKPGDRLPPQREFAFHRKIAVSTASRVYGELVRRGLVSGEVGRGTYVRTATAKPVAALAEPRAETVDLELNFPVLSDQGAQLARSLDGLLTPGMLGSALGALGASATPQARDVAARFLTCANWSPSPQNILFTGNGRQALAATFAAIAPPGDRIGVEALTYPVIKGIAARLGITLVPLALDEHGLRPDAIAQAQKDAPLRAVYLQPSLHNPLGVTMRARRRDELADALKATDLFAIEDVVNAFLIDDTPLAAFVPERTIVIDSLSKRVAPGMTLGFIVAPPALIDKIAAAVRSGAWAPAGWPLSAGLRLMDDGTATRIATAKREDAVDRQKIARTILSDLKLVGDPRAYHLWMELPEAWRAEPYAAAAARLGIALTAASAFAVSPGHAPNAVRLALSSPPVEALAVALETLHRLAMSDPVDSGIE